EKELEDLSREIKERPASVTWFPSQQGGPTSVLAVWGSVKIEELGWSAMQAVEAGEGRRFGVLVDSLGDLKRSAREGVPVYRVVGGPGYVYAASFEANGRGQKSSLAIDGAQLAIRQFE